MASRYEPKDINKIFEELRSDSDRAVIAVGGSLIEYALEQAIASRLRPPQSKVETDVFFHDKGIIGTFFEKVWMAYFLKIIGPEVRRDIELIRAIRNVAAHDMNPISFTNTPEISSRCSQLKFAEQATWQRPTPPVGRDRFLLTVQFFTANLLMRSADGDAVIAEASATLSPYLDK